MARYNRETVHFHGCKCANCKSSVPYGNWAYQCPKCGAWVCSGCQSISPCPQCKT